ncbi:uncharacterized protein BDZ99DRAFT_509861 [Mytilinidion resinicola]|uniref:Dipeptidyl peptidase III n=1 Tax=Mytilinidion resinicola TaxID=574789 RepID=A0A6A6YGI5_9PEZI|nr:uncharacterized protein BDZ99DRAFT_509861 [Mytilinidion resinicola]KAF2807643.1 hypothetical protein BDZ99DRAFT_509861 [Mytilinidion resinicola]
MGVSRDTLFADTDAPICKIPCATAFSELNQQERLYTHHMCRASFHGARVLLRQTSQESEEIFDLIIALSKAAGGQWGQFANSRGVSGDDLKYFLEYASMFLGNVGNYRVGHSNSGEVSYLSLHSQPVIQKFVPRLSTAALENLCQANDETKTLYKAVAKRVYATSPYQYGFSADRSSSSGYYPSESLISKQEVDAIDETLFKHGILLENTRISKKDSESSNLASFVLHITSSETSWLPSSVPSPYLDFPGGKVLKLQTGDHADSLKKVVSELEHAKNYAGNDTQENMISALISSFKTGNHEEFKRAQIYWVQDRSPAIESVIGFIENYQDPQGIRGAWEGIIAVVNKIQSKSFTELVERSSEFISAFETSEFIKPDFTSLDTIGFVKSESPAGLNLPNFEDICQTVGSKNLEFGNVDNANPPDEKIPFIREEELEFMREYREMVFEVLIACHELLGYGSGRVTLWYKHGQTWSAIFGADVNALEECRADGVSLVLLTDERILKIFWYSGEVAKHVIYAGYPIFLYRAIKGLSRWNPETKALRGIPISPLSNNVSGKFALLRCILNCGPDILRIKERHDDIKIVLNELKITTHAVPTLRKFLLKLQIDVDDTFARYHLIVLAKESPRIQYVQPNTFVEYEEVNLREYPATKEALIQSWVERDI